MTCGDRWKTCSCSLLGEFTKETVHNFFAHDQTEQNYHIIVSDVEDK